MADLQDFMFTILPDLAIASDGWILTDGSVDANLGDDSIAGSGSEIGIQIQHSILEASLGDDSLSGEGISAGLRNTGSALITMGIGNDLIQAEATGSGDGLLNEAMSIIETDLGDDQIQALAATEGTGLRNSHYSLITTGIGNDSITGEGGDHGLLNEIGSEIHTGVGNDRILGSATQAEGLVNAAGCRIDTGLGNDWIVARAAVTTRALQNGAIHDLWNDGCIVMGQGRDTLDALSAGFRGNGTVRLGGGDDQLKGFGSGTFLGGRGLDELTFNSGTYAISSEANGFYRIGELMRVKGFESFGSGASTPSFADAAAAGSITFA